MTVRDKIQSWCDTSLADLIKQYDQQGRRASGQWEKDLESSIESTVKGYNIKILGSHYSYYMENGRRPGKFPPISAIRQWIDDKGIIAQGISRNSLAFLIARKIAREGYKGRPVIATVITDDWIHSLVISVGNFLVEDIRSDVLQELKAA